MADPAAAAHAPASPPTQPAARAGAEPHRESVKETLVSIIIAFILAFVFRGFVVEAFVIPTGSMAPTLMGAHMRFRGPESGYSWPVGPWDRERHNQTEYLPVQGTRERPIVVHDPMTGQRIEQSGVPRRSGDRILVLKFLYGLYGPSRYDVVVFKNPTEPQVNFIKRLIGLPGEQIALVDGDVFVRTPDVPEETADDGTWSRPGWRIARKPARVQQDVWQPVFDSRYAPLNPQRDGRFWYNTPWVAGSATGAAGGAAGWSIDGRRVYEYSGQGPTQLEWDRARVRYVERGPPWGNVTETWEIDDRYMYDEDRDTQSAWWTRFPVSDVRLRAGFEPERDGTTVTATVAARGHEFQAVLDGAARTVLVRMRPALGSGAERSNAAGEWTDLGTGRLPRGALSAGRVTDVEFWHTDQSLQVWIDGRRAATGAYEWTPEERIRHATGQELSELVSRRSMAGANVFGSPGLYRRPEVRWGFSGGAFRLHRVGLDRDLHYQPVPVEGGRPTLEGLATHPARTPHLSPSEFFTLGDNSPASADGRAWGHPDPWVAKQMWRDKGLEPKAGVVPRELMIGKAFFVYFPSLHRDGTVPVPDFGRLRFIW